MRAVFITFFFFTLEANALCHNYRISHDINRWSDPDILILPLFSYCDENSIDNNREIVILNKSPKIVKIEFYPDGVDNGAVVIEFRDGFLPPHIPPFESGIPIYNNNSYLNMAYFYKAGIDHVPFAKGLIEVAHSYGGIATKISMDNKYFYIETKNPGSAYASLTVVDYFGESRLKSKLVHGDFLALPDIQLYIDPFVVSSEELVNAVSIGQRGLLENNRMQLDGREYIVRDVDAIKSLIEAVPEDVRTENSDVIDDVYESIALQAVDIPRPSLLQNMRQHGYVLSAIQYLLLP